MSTDDYSSIDDLINDSDLDENNFDEEDENGFDDLEDFNGISGDGLDIDEEKDNTESEDVLEDEEE